MAEGGRGKANRLHELKDAVYDAEDLLDDIAFEALQQSCISEWQKTGLSPKMEEILAILEFIVQQKDALGLKEVQGKSSWKLATSLVEYGGDGGKEVVINPLLDDVSGDEISAITLVGMGGVGESETTFAQLVYNDVGVKEQFDLRAWIYVSGEHDIFRVTERILDRKFLLVLDDVWNENHIEWEALWISLKSVARGSKIFMITRNERVASVMHSVSTLHLKQLSNEDCWLLFAKHSFDSMDCQPCPKLEEIRKRIANECKGLPLAAKMLGCLLHSNGKISFFLMHELVNDLAKFASGEFCSRMGNETSLDSVWRTQYDTCMRCEPIYEAKHLCTSFPFQMASEYGHFLNNEVLHDLIMRRRCLQTVFSSHYENVIELPCSIGNLKYLCSLVLYSTSIKILPNSMCNLLHLQTLILSSDCSLEELPDSIGKLKHLRYLNLHSTSIKRLPNSFYILHLQTLIPPHSRSLEELLPWEG